MDAKHSGTETVTSVSGDPKQDSIMNEKQPRTKSFYQRHPQEPRPLRRRPNNTDAILSLDTQNQPTLTKMGRVYDRLLGSSIIVRYAVWMLPVSALLSIPLILGFTKYKHAELGGVSLGYIGIYAEIIWNSLWISKLAAKMVPYLFQFLSGWVNPASRKYFRAIQASEVPLSFIGWSLISWTTFLPVMTRNPHALETGTGVRHWENNLNQLLAASLICSCTWFIESFSIQLIAINYHRKAFSDKIKESKLQTKLLTIMYEASTRMFPQYCPEFEDEDYLISHSITPVAPITPTGERPPSTHMPVRMVRELGRLSDKAGAIFSRIAQEITGRKGHVVSDSFTTVVEALEKPMKSEALGRRLFATFSGGEVEMLTPDDFIAIIGKDQAEDAKQCFQMLDKDGNGDVSEQELVSGVVAIGQSMKALSWSVHDVQECVRKLDDILLVAVFVLNMWIYITFVSSDKTSKLVANASTFLLGLSWLFGSTGAEFLQSCIFIFAKHPFDVGDRVDIGSDSYIVEHIDLLYTSFKRVNNQKITQIANNSLSGQWIDNITRSQSMRDCVNLFIHFDTSMQDINLLRSEMTNFVMDKENSRDFMPEIFVEVAGVAEMNKLELRVSFDHKSNWANETLRSIRRTKFLCGLVQIIHSIPIYGPGGGGAGSGDPANPAYSVTITPEEAAQNKEKFTANKLAKRKVPVAVPEERIFDSRNETIVLPPTIGDDRIMPAL